MDPQAVTEPDRSVVRRLRNAADRQVQRRPVTTTALLAVIVALGSAIWLWSNRSGQLFDADESKYLADAIRFADAARSGPGTLLTQVRTTGTAPLVPLSATPFLLVSANEPRAAFLIQGVLLVVAASTITSITRRLTGALTAVLAGVAFATFPATLLALQSFQYGLAVVAMLGVAVAALVHSEQGTNRLVWLVGTAAAAMVLSRTMALVFVVPLLLAGIATTWPNRRGMLRLGASFGIGTVLALPWYLLQREAIFGYLFQYGYGDRSSSYGPDGAVFQALSVLGRLVSLADPLLSAVAIVAVAVVAVRWLRRSDDLAGRVRRFIDTAAFPLVVLLLSGAAILMTSSNQGGWFTAPLYIAAVPLSAMAIERSGTVIRSVAVAAVAVHIVGMLLLNGWWAVPYRWVDPLVPYAISTYPEDVFAEADQRLGPDLRDQRQEAEAEWAAATLGLERRLAAFDGDRPAVFTIVGNGRMLNGNAVTLTALGDGWYPDIQLPDTADADTDWGEHLSPTAWNRAGDEVERIIVVIDREDDVFPADAGSEEFRRSAIDDGWKVVARAELPVGAVEILRHGV